MERKELSLSQTQAKNNGGNGGRSVTGTNVNTEGHLIVTFSDNTTQDLGLVRVPGPEGPGGEPGPQGGPGPVGPPGADYEFEPIAENQVGTHPAFATRRELELYLLGKLSVLDYYVQPGYVVDGYIIN